MAKKTHKRIKEVISLDMKDKRLLFELDKNARESLSNLAKKIGCSRQTTRYRLDKLVELGVIKNFLTIINAEKLGYSFYNIYLQLEGMNKKTEEAFCRFVKNYPSTDWVVSGNGRWNYIISVLAKDNKDFNKSLLKILNKAGSHLKDHALFIVTEAYQMPYRYLFSDLKLKYDKQVYIGGENVKYKKSDLEILQKLSENARISSAELAREFNICKSQVKYKIDKMVNSGLIQAYRPLLNLEKLDYDWFAVFLNFKNINQEEEVKFINFLKSIPFVNFIIKGIGKWSLLLELHTEGMTHFNELINKMTDKFSNVIKSYEYTHVLKEHKCNFFPQGVLG